MNRRRFLVSTAAGAAAMSALGGAAFGKGQGQATTPPPQGRGGQGGGGRGVGSPANVAAAKLARVSLMTLNFGNMLKFPWTPNPNENQTLDVFDLPKMYQDIYGCESYRVPARPSRERHATPPDAAFFRRCGPNSTQQRSRPSQVNIEIGTIPNLAGEAREKWMALGGSGSTRRQSSASHA